MELTEVTLRSAYAQNAKEDSRGYDIGDKAENCDPFHMRTNDCTTAQCHLWLIEAEVLRIIPFQLDLPFRLK